MCTSECAHDGQMRSRFPSQVPELPSNVTHGLCFDPLASHSPQPPLKPTVYCSVCMCVCGVGWGLQGCMHSAPLSLLCSKFTPSCPYSQCQFLFCSFVNVCSAGLITAEQGLALFPAHSAIRSLRGIHSYCCFFTAQGFFSKRERQLLSPSFL